MVDDGRRPPATRPRADHAPARPCLAPVNLQAASSNSASAAGSGRPWPTRIAGRFQQLVAGAVSQERASPSRSSSRWAAQVVGWPKLQGGLIPRAAAANALRLRDRRPASRNANRAARPTRWCPASPRSRNWRAACQWWASRLSPVSARSGASASALAARGAGRLWRPGELAVGHVADQDMAEGVLALPGDLAAALTTQNSCAPGQQPLLQHMRLTVSEAARAPKPPTLPARPHPRRAFLPGEGVQRAAIIPARSPAAAGPRPDPAARFPRHC